MNYAIVVFLVQVLDVISTLSFLFSGRGVEGNPLVIYLWNHFGIIGLSVQFAFTVISLGFIYELVKKVEVFKIIMWLLIAIHILVVIHNFTL